MKRKKSRLAGAQKVESWSKAKCFRDFRGRAPLIETCIQAVKDTTDLVVQGKASYFSEAVEMNAKKCLNFRNLNEQTACITGTTEVLLRSKGQTASLEGRKKRKTQSMLKAPKLSPPKLYIRGKDGLGRYDPKLRDALTIIDPKTKKEYKVGGDIIVDSGASGLAIAMKEFDRMTGKLELSGGRIRKMVVGTAAGPIVVPLAPKLAYCVKNSCVKADVMGSFSRETLLGMDFLETAGCSIDFKKKSMKCGSNEFKIGPKFGIFRIKRR